MRVVHLAGSAAADRFIAADVLAAMVPLCATLGELHCRGISHRVLNAGLADRPRTDMYTPAYFKMRDMDGGADGQAEQRAWKVEVLTLPVVGGSIQCDAFSLL